MGIYYTVSLHNRSETTDQWEVGIIPKRQPEPAHRLQITRTLNGKTVDEVVNEAEYPKSLSTKYTYLQGQR